VLLVCVERMRRMLFREWLGSTAFDDGIATGDSILRSGPDSAARFACEFANT
jgi:hypothetical protein